MAASQNDTYIKVGEGTATTLASPGYTIGGTSATVVSTTNWPTDTGVIFAIDTAEIINGEQVQVAGTYTEYEGTVATATSVTNVSLVSGTPQNYSAGALTRVYIPLSAEVQNRMVDGLLVSHTQTGAMIASLPLTTPKITTSINDANGNEVIKTPATASAVNEITVTNAATGNSPKVEPSGGDSAIHLNLRGKGLAKTVTIGAGAATIFPYDYVASGCVWSGDSYGGSLAASMTSGVVVINGNPITVAAVTARAFTTNVDTYIDVLDAGDGTGTVVYTTAATNAASPALASNSIRIGIIQAAATITAATKVNQGQEDKVFPIASSIPYAVTDSLGNLICPRDPFRSIIGYRQILADQGSITTVVDLTGLSVPFIAITGRKIEASAYVNSTNGTADAYNIVNIQEGATVLQAAGVNSRSGSINETLNPEYLATPSAGLHTYKLTAQGSGGTMTARAGATQPAFIRIRLV